MVTVELVFPQEAMNNNGHSCLSGPIVISLPYNNGSCHLDSLRVFVDGDSLTAADQSTMIL